MKKTLITLTMLLTATAANASIYLRSGESITLGRNTVYCENSNQNDSKYFCTYDACLKDENIHNTSISNCKFFKGYKSKTQTVWAFTGRAAVKRITNRLNADNNIIDFKNLDCN